jgi:hypothetical protein
MEDQSKGYFANAGKCQTIANTILLLLPIRILYFQSSSSPICKDDVLPISQSRRFGVLDVIHHASSIV